jgi:hypothetical protein
MARYKITMDDVQYAQEFLRDPFGYHTPGLQRVLNVMRSLGPEGKYVILCTEPHRRWQLARLPARRGDAIIALEDIEYGDLASAERDVFLRRWHDLGGPEFTRAG